MTEGSYYNAFLSKLYDNIVIFDIVIIYSTDSVTFYLWRNIPTYLPTYISIGYEELRQCHLPEENAYC